MNVRTINAYTKVSVLAIALAATSACTGVRSKPECPVPDGPRCLSTIEAYERTHGDTPDLDGLRDYERQEAVDRDVRGDMQRRAVMPAAPVAQDGTLVLTSMTNNAAYPRESAYPASMTPPDVVASESAYRVPATVMRVWINAWEDEEGGLHLPQKVFREVEPRRWSVGEKAPSSGMAYRLLESPTGPAKESQAAAPKGAGAGS